MRTFFTPRVSAVFSILAATALSLLLGCQTPAQTQPDPQAGTTAQPAETTQVAATPEPSSEIPARREFPVDPAVNACEDFYAYACNKVNASFKLPDDRSRHVFSFNDSYERILAAKKKWLAELQTREPKSPRQKDLRTIYAACMDAEASKKEEQAAVQKVVDTIEGFANRKALQNYAGTKVISGEGSFFHFGNVANHDDPGWDDIYLIVGMRTLPERSYYHDEKVVADFRTLLVDFFKTIKMDKPEKRADWVLNFETRSADSFPLPAEIREIFSSRTSIKRSALKKNYPTFKLNAFLKHVPKRTHFRHFTPDNFAFLNKALKKDDLEALKSVYIYNSAQKYLDDAYPEYFNKAFAFRNKHLGGAKTRPDRQERCTTLVMGSFRKEIDAEMIDVMFPNFPEEKFIALAEKIRSAIIDSVEANDWLSPEGKAGALAKMREARLQLVKPKTDAEWDFNPHVEFDAKHPYQNLERLAEALGERRLKRLGEPRNKDRWAMGPLTVNAYYSPSDNKFVMPIGILQYPFYDPNLSETVNLGAVGVVIGHELGHGVDDKGSRYDSKGRLKTWMSKADIKEFARRGDRLISQFEKAGFNGQLTLGENIGDLTGLTFGYRAAFPKGKGSVEDKRAFFTQYARLWCHTMRPKQRELRIKTDPHSTGDGRVNEQVKHQPGFREAFSCKSGDPMVIDTPVSIW